MADENTKILDAIAANHVEVVNRIDGLAQRTGLSLARIEGDVARIEGGVNALRADVHARARRHH